MKRFALALALLATGCGGEPANDLSAVNEAAPLPQIAAPNGGDWTQIVTQTESGGFLLGNPDAPVKLVEYASITCPHCGEFAEAATEELENVFVRSGQVSWEYRPFSLFPSDPGIFALLRCQGATPFFRLTHQLYESQSEWSGRLQALPPEQMQALETMPAEARAAAIVQAAGVDQFFRQRGMPESRVRSCLGDAAAIQREVDLTQAAGERDNVQGTPTFLINGERTDADQWSEVKPLLRAQIGG